MPHLQIRILATLICAGIMSGCQQDPIQSRGSHDAVPTPALQSEQVHDPVPMVTVYFTTTKAPLADQRIAVAAIGGRSFVERYQGFPAAVTLPRSRLAEFRAKSWVRIVEVDSLRKYFPTSTSTRRAPAPLYMSETIPWGVASIGATQVHSSLGITGAGVKVAILDHGPRVSHADLGNFVACRDVINSSNSCTLGALDHGTKVAGVLAAEEDGTGIVGVAPGADLYGVIVCDVANGCDESAIYGGIVWSIANNMDVVSISIGNCGATPGLSLGIALATAVSAGIQVVAAAGNGDNPYDGVNEECDSTDPVSGIAAWPGVYAVAAHGTDLGFKSWYQYGSAIDFSAPTDVSTTSHSGGWILPPAVFSGTSAATPHLAGTLALMLEAGFQPGHLYQRLQETAFNPNGSGHSNEYGWGLIRVDDAIVAKPRVNYLTWCTNTGITQAGNCSFTANLSNGIAPLQVKFEVTRSDVAGVTEYGYGPPARTINIPAGDYTLIVKATPREQGYLRVGYHTIQEIPVCTEDQFTASGGERMKAATCGGAGEEN